MDRVVTGVFNGECMNGDDGKRYPVFGNYASKSCLVTGDELKLTITDDGKFIYKQLKATERKRMLMKVIKEDGCPRLINERGRIYEVLRATSTFFQLEEGDEVVGVVPRDQESYYAAVEIVTNR